MSDEPDDVLLSHLDTYVAAAIGRVITAWAILEHSINEAIWALAGVEREQGACITSQLTSVARRIDALISLARVQKISESTVAKFNKFKSKASDLAERRNRIAHDPWYYGFDSKNHYRLQITARSTLDFAYKPTTEEDLLKIEREIQALAEHFSKLRSDVMDEFYAKLS